VLAELDRQKQAFNQNKEELAAGMNQLSKQVEEVKKANYVTLDILKARDLSMEVEARRAKGEEFDRTRVEQTIAKLERYAQEDPINRILHIVLANLHYELGKIEIAVEILQKFIKAREEANQAQDDDVATAWFNLACYYAELAGIEKDDKAKEVGIKKAAETLEQCFAVAIKASKSVFAIHVKRAEDDPDLAILRARNLLGDIIERVKNTGG